jgi:KaiC/GvpD/RAD55 family RecA-like ATPase
MVKEELIKRSPLRLLEKSIHGGVGAGNIGVIAARKGTGKTACLVHIATDQLFQGKHVIHVSFAGRTDHIISWYEDIFGEIAKKRNLENAMEIHDDLIKNRVVMNFNQEGVTR